MNDRVPVNPASLSVPEKVITSSDGLYSLRDGETWGGLWAFPPAWSEAERSQWTAIHGNLIAEQRRFEEATSKLSDYLVSPAAMIANAQHEVSETQRAREAQERTHAGAVAWQDARERYATVGVESMQTVEGDVIIMVAMTTAEADVTNARSRALAEAVLRSDPKAEARAYGEQIGAQRDAMLAKIRWPDRERVKAIAAKRASLWTELREMRDRLMRVRVDLEGKDSAL